MPFSLTVQGIPFEKDCKGVVRYQENFLKKWWGTCRVDPPIPTPLDCKRL